MLRNTRQGKHCLFFLSYLLVLLAYGSSRLCAQVSPVVPGTPITLGNAPRPDSSAKTNTSEWSDEEAQVHMRRAFSQVKIYPDSGIHTFHRRPYSQPWYRDLGNLGSPARNLIFTPQQQTGLTLGYRALDVYRFFTDSLLYYTTTRPYTSFTYQLGSKLEQTASVLHTQNVRPNWNVAAQYRKTSSPGYYKIQRNNHDNAALTTNYQGRDLRYELYGALVYNRQQHDENGGITADSFLSDAQFSDKATIPVRFQRDDYSASRSAVTNNQRDFNLLLLHSYTLGRTDTLYNEDSTRYSFKLVPRFSIAHRFDLGTEKYRYKDLRPDSLKYLPLFTGQTINAGDSVFMDQKWFCLNNTVSLKGFLGPEGKQILFSAGIGNRLDRFATVFEGGSTEDNIVSNYLTGTIRKEALAAGQWDYNADAVFYVTGAAAGNFSLRGSIGKDLPGNTGIITIGFRQQLHNAPYNYTIHRTRYDDITASLNKESITQLYATVHSDRLKLTAGVRNYLLSNYIYLSELQRPAQYATAFNVTQAWLGKLFRLGIVVLDNEIAWQQVAGAAPVNVPALLGRHQLSIETWLFKKALKIASGVEIRYHTAYFADAWSPFFSRFYYQSSHSIGNNPEASVFFNFKVKKFRAYIMGDQLQQFFGPNNITAPGYPGQNAMLRFGFNWIMIN